MWPNIDRWIDKVIKKRWSLVFLLLLYNPYAHICMFPSIGVDGIALQMWGYFITYSLMISFAPTKGIIVPYYYVSNDALISMKYIALWTFMWYITYIPPGNI